jgi:formylglycine-generating enzyme required for sulfatase activity
VTGGTYFRTYTSSSSGPTGEADPATVSSLRLDRYEVTVGRFRRFVNAWKNGSGFLPPAGSGKHAHLNGGKGLAATAGGYEPGWVASDDANVAPTAANLACGDYPTWTPAAGSHENLPINCVNWWEASAFCIWDGGFLPSEAEWEYAAAGGSQEREYPWGSTAPGTTNQYAIYSCYYPNGSGACSNPGNGIAPVGTATLGVGRWGQLDLAGNVYEWSLDYYDGYADPCVDCSSLTGSYRVLRGSSYGWPESQLVPPYRFESQAVVRNSNFGFRCARTP